MEDRARAAAISLSALSGQEYARVHKDPRRLGLLALHAWLLYLVTILGAFYAGVAVVGPANLRYLGYGPAALQLHTGACWFIFLEMMLNWLLLRSVDSACRGPPLDAHRSHYNPSGIYSYFDWKPCHLCRIWRPPRVHHCPICRRCVLKRDHHCYFSNSCVGLRNQRHFIVFTFWSTVATGYATAHGVLFLCTAFLPERSYADVLLPLALVRCLLGYVGPETVLWVAVGYLLLFFLPTSLSQFAEQCQLILKGKTGFENDLNVTLVCRRSRAETLRGIFGKYWFLNFLLPLHKVFPQEDDGFEWPGVEVKDQREFFIPIVFE